MPTHRQPFTLRLATAALSALVAAWPLGASVSKVGTVVAASACEDCDQALPSIAGGKALAIVGWEGQTVQEDDAANARFFLATGVAKGPNVRLNAASPFVREDQVEVASGGPAGSFVAVWRQRTTSTNSDILMRRFSNLGKPLGDAAPVVVDDPLAPTNETNPAVHVAADGSILVAWISAPVPGIGPPGNPSVLWRRFDAAGNAVTAPVMANSSLAATNRPAICGDLGGVAVVAFNTLDRIVPFVASKLGVAVRRFSSAGVPLGAEATIAKPLAQASQLDLSCSPLGGSVVAFAYDAKPASGEGDVLWQRFDKTGKKLGKLVSVSSASADAQRQPAVAHDAKGNWVAVWQASGLAARTIVARRFLATGKPDGADVLVTAGEDAIEYVGDPDVAFYGTKGEFAVVWDRARLHVELQRFAAK